MYDWAQGCESVAIAMFALYSADEKYIGTVVRRKGNKDWNAIPFVVGEQAEVIDTGALIVAQVRLQEWYKKRSSTKL